MLDAATWRAKNRRHFDVVEALYERIERPLQSGDWDPADDSEYAAGLVHNVGSLLLAMSIDAGTTKGEKSSNRRSGRAWKSITADSGVRASVFLTVAVAAILSPEIEGEGLSQEAVSGARELVERVFGLPSEDIERIEQVKASVVETLNDEFTKEAVARGGLADSMAIQRGQTAFSYEAMRLAGVNVSELPAFEPVRDVPSEMWDQIAGFDWLITFSISFGYRWKGAKESFIDMAYTRSGIDASSEPGNSLFGKAAKLWADASWEWHEVPGAAVVKTADKLSNFREDYNLILDAISLGFWIREAEVELTDSFNTFDPEHVEHLRERYSEGEPDAILMVSMNQVRETLPEPFGLGSKIWSEIVQRATELLKVRGEHILAEREEFDEHAEISDDLREFTLGLGYGLAFTVDALGIDGTRLRQEQTP
jgi:hypothetical protein